MVQFVAPSATSESSYAARTWVSARGNVLSLAPHLLMFLQFGIAFQIEKSAENLEQNMVNFSIALFAATSLMYQKYLRDAQIISIAAHLLPEVIIAGVIALLFYHQLTFGFLVMVSGMFLMALSVVMGTVYQLLLTSDNDTAKIPPSCPTPEPSEVEILVV